MTSILSRRPHGNRRVSKGRHPSSRIAPDGRGPRRRAGRRGSLFLLLLVAIISLSLIGLVMVLSASSVTALQTYGDSWYFFRRQALWMGVGAIALFVTSNIHYRFWARLATPILVSSFVMLLLVLIPGVGRNLNGSSRWLAVYKLSFQPSEFVKFALVVFVAELLSRPGRPMSNTRLTLNPVLFVLAIAVLLLLLEPDLGTAIILGFIVMMMLVAAGASGLHLAGLATAGSVFVALAAASSGYRRRRVFAFIDPWADPLD
ncbi:MAG: FtsW/RodA/SpoVE family cell cycle protein, partial [Acidimicrobiales bacterium]